MSRSHRLCSPQLDHFPAAFERDLMATFSSPPGADRLLIGRSWSTSWSRRPPAAYVTVPVFAAEMRRRGWSARAIRAATFRLHRYSEELDSADLAICRRAYRRCMRQLVAAGRYDELDAFPHRRWDNWW